MAKITIERKGDALDVRIEGLKALNEGLIHVIRTVNDIRILRGLQRIETEV